MLKKKSFILDINLLDYFSQIRSKKRTLKLVFVKPLMISTKQPLPTLSPLPNIFQNIIYLNK